MLSSEVMGVVLVRVEGEYWLGYLAFTPTDPTMRAPSDVSELPSLMKKARLHFFWGGPPTSLDVPNPAETELAVPEPVRVLASVHASLTDYTAEWSMDTATLDQSLGEILRERFAQEDEEYGKGEEEDDDDFSADYDGHRLLASYPPGVADYFLVPDEGDQQDRCLVATFDYQDMNVKAIRPFWEWFRLETSGALFGH